MTEKTRMWTTFIYFGAMIGVIVSALVFKIALLVLIFLIIEVGAYVWYIASYIPFARECMKNAFKNCLGDDSK